MIQYGAGSLSPFNESENSNGTLESSDAGGDLHTSRRNTTDLPERHEEPDYERRSTQGPPHEVVGRHSLARKKIATLSPDYSQTSLDYELFEIDDPQWHGPNEILIPTEIGTASQRITPTHVAQKPAERDIWAAIGENGAVKGTLLAAPHYLKMKHSPNFQEMWVVRLQSQTSAYTLNTLHLFLS